MGLHDLGASMRPHLQERIDAADEADTMRSFSDTRSAAEELKACAREKRRSFFPGRTIASVCLMGSRQLYQTYFEAHSGVYFRFAGLD